MAPTCSIFWIVGGEWRSIGRSGTACGAVWRDVAEPRCGYPSRLVGKGRVAYAGTAGTGFREALTCNYLTFLLV